MITDLIEEPKKPAPDLRPTPQSVADALGKLLPRRVSIYQVELIQATGGCSARARIGCSSVLSGVYEISGLGEDLDAAIVALENTARGWSWSS